MKVGSFVVATVLCACGDSSKAPVAPIVVVDQPSPSPAAASATPAQVVDATPAPAPSLPPAPPTTEDDEPKGNVWGDSIGDSFGPSGAPARDAGAGGIGRIGKSSAGSGSGGVITSNTGTKSPTLRQGAITVTGKLPPEVIQRIARQSFGRFRLCYENGLRAKPKLTGRVAVKFTIDRSGAVSKSADGGSDLPDKDVIACVVKGFSNLSFPQPEAGEVTVVYPIIFSPGD